jgi:hypothetical protein
MGVSVVLLFSVCMEMDQVAHPDWSAFMLKPLIPKVTVDDARRLFGIATDRFLISWLDTT